MRKVSIDKEVTIIEQRAAQLFTLTDTDIIAALATFCKLKNPDITEADLVHCEFDKDKNELIYVTKLLAKLAGEEKSSGGESLAKAPVHERV